MQAALSIYLTENYEEMLDETKRRLFDVQNATDCLERHVLKIN